MNISDIYTGTPLIMLMSSPRRPQIVYTHPIPFPPISSWGLGNSIMVSVSVYEAGCPGLSPARSVCISQKGGDLPAYYQLVPTSADDWFTKDRPCAISI